MKQPIVWTGSVNDEYHVFSYQRVKGKHILTINGAPITIKPRLTSSLIGFDEPFVFNGLPARFVIEKRQPDVVVNGVYSRSGKVYRPRPKWAIVFAFICIALPIASLGGALPALMGFGGAALCVTIAKSTMPAAARVILCVLTTIAAWALWFFLVIGFMRL